MSLPIPALALLLLLVALAACSSPSETPQAPTLQQAAETAAEPSATPSPTSPSVPTSATEVHEDPEGKWVTDRISAVVSLYDLTPEGVGAIQSLDIRWMQDQPGFFGSFGFRSWTGWERLDPAALCTRLAMPTGALFPVTGFPELSWDVSRGDEISPAMMSYHSGRAGVHEAAARPVRASQEPPSKPAGAVRRPTRPDLSPHHRGRRHLHHRWRPGAAAPHTEEVLGQVPGTRPLRHSWDEAFRWYLFPGRGGQDRLANQVHSL